MNLGDELRDPASFAAWNEAMVERYDIDEYYRDAHPLVRWVERRRLRALRRLARPGPGDRMLEVGVGGGHVLQQFADVRRFGVDISPAMLRRAGRRLGPDVPLTRADAEALPFAAPAFEIVLCTEVLEHTRSPERVLGELVRMAGATGRIVVSIPNEATIDRIKRALMSVPGLRTWLRTLSGESNEWHLHRFDLANFRALAAGRIDLVAVKAIPFRWVPIRYVVLARAPRPDSRN